MSPKIDLYEAEETHEEPILQKEIERLIDRALKDRMIELSLEDIKIIAKEIMPDLDEMIAIKMKKHFHKIGEFLIEKFN